MNASPINESIRALLTRSAVDGEAGSHRATIEPFRNDDPVGAGVILDPHLLAGYHVEHHRATIDYNSLQCFRIGPYDRGDASVQQSSPLSLNEAHLPRPRAHSFTRETRVKCGDLPARTIARVRRGNDKLHAVLPAFNAGPLRP
jgi:hypothetical protein